MAKFLDQAGLTTLWNKIKNTFVPLSGNFSIEGKLGTFINFTNIRGSSIELIRTNAYRVVLYCNGVGLSVYRNGAWIDIVTLSSDGLTVNNDDCTGTGITIDNYKGTSYIFNIDKAIELGIFEEA